MLSVQGAIDFLGDRAWLAVRRSRGARRAAESMQRLNGHAREKGWLRDLIYRYKDLLIEELCRAGYQRSIGVEIQEMGCFRCKGTGRSVHEQPAYQNCPAPLGEACPGHRCLHCSGGIYARHELYRFEFDVQGLKVGWHQPRERARVEVIPTEDEVGRYHAPEPGSRLSDGEVRRSLLLVESYLREKGVRWHANVFTEAYRRSWALKLNMLRARRRMTRWMKNVITLVRSDLKVKWSEEDIPF